MLEILLVILKKKKYALIALLTIILMGAIFYFLTVINVSQKSILIYAEMNGVWFTVSSLLFSLIIALLFGFYVSLLIFKRDIAKISNKGNKAASGVGAATGIIASGCPSCGTPLLGLVGLPLGLSALPFKGLELKILSIGLLILSIYLICNSIKKNLACERQK